MVMLDRMKSVELFKVGIKKKAILIFSRYTLEPLDDHPVNQGQLGYKIGAWLTTQRSRVGWGIQ